MGKNDQVPAGASTRNSSRARVNRAAQAHAAAGDADDDAADASDDAAADEGAARAANQSSDGHDGASGAVQHRTCTNAAGSTDGSNQPGVCLSARRCWLLPP